MKYLFNYWSFHYHQLNLILIHTLKWQIAKEISHTPKLFNFAFLPADPCYILPLAPLLALDRSENPWKLVADTSHTLYPQFVRPHCIYSSFFPFCRPGFLPSLSLSLSLSPATVTVACTKARLSSNPLWIIKIQKLAHTALTARILTQKKGLVRVTWPPRGYIRNRAFAYNACVCAATAAVSRPHHVCSALRYAHFRTTRSLPGTASISLSLSLKGGWRMRGGCRPWTKEVPRVVCDGKKRMSEERREKRGKREETTGIPLIYTVFIRGRVVFVRGCVCVCVCVFLWLALFLQFSGGTLNLHDSVLTRLFPGARLI